MTGITNASIESIAARINLRITPKKRLMRATPAPVAVPRAINQTWSMDFMHHELSDGRTFRISIVIHDFNREALTLEAAESLPAERVVRALNQRITWLGQPQRIRCDNGPVQECATRCLRTCNDDRPNMALGGITPVMKLARAA